MLYNVKFVKALNLTDIDEMILHSDDNWQPCKMDQHNSQIILVSKVVSLEFSTTGKLMEYILAVENLSDYKVKVQAAERENCTVFYNKENRRWEKKENGRNHYWDCPDWKWVEI